MKKLVFALVVTSLVSFTFAQNRNTPDKAALAVKIHELAVANSQNTAIAAIDGYAKSAPFNQTSLLMAADMIKQFPKQEADILAIAKLASESNRENGYFGMLCRLVVLDAPNAKTFISLAEQLKSVTDEGKIAELYKKINAYKGNTKFGTIQEAMEASKK